MKTTRTHYSQLPPNDELAQILKTESARRPIFEKAKVHFINNFKEVIAWLDAIGCSIRLFSGNPKVEEILKLGEELQTQVVSATTDGVQSKNKKLFRVLSEVTKYMNLEDKPEKSDMILVFGSKSLSRPEMAVRFWKRKLAPIVVFSGGHPHYKGENDVPEAVFFARHAISLGLPKDRILVESNSITVADNVKTTLNLLDHLEVKYRRIITVGSWFMQRRASSHLMKLTPKGTIIYSTDAPITSPDLSADNWFKNETGIKIIFNEFVKLRLSVALNTA